MQHKISNEALEAYCYCRLKFHLKLRGERGVKTDYEIIRAEFRADTKARAIQSHVADQGSGNGFRLTRARLEKASQYIFNGIYEDDDFTLHIDGVNKSAAPKDPHSYSFRPIIFSSSIRNEKAQRLVLRVYGYAVSTPR
jgi:hypothetical protein